jgi:hypothetical protein
MAAADRSNLDKLKRAKEKADGGDGEEEEEEGGEKGKKRKKNKNRDKVMYHLETRYPVMDEVCAEFANWKGPVATDAYCDLIWSDQAIPAERLSKMRTYQKINHFVGMCAITRKNNLGL